MNLIENREDNIKIVSVPSANSIATSIDTTKKLAAGCRAEGVVSLRAHVGFEKGRAFCFTMAPDADAVRRAHERVGLPFDDITEVMTSTPGDIFFARTPQGEAR